MSKIPFRAALFDLDGTLLDSMSMWRRIDEMFFNARGMEIPADYCQAIAGLSYKETAEYTVKNYLPNDTCEGLMAEWARMSDEEYHQRIPLKPGAKEYLEMLHRAGVRLAVATALSPRVFEPCLKRLGVLDLFEALCSTDHTDGRGKASGEVYLLAASQLGVDPEDCVVFEDVLAGIIGAKKAGMKAYCVLDDHSKADFDAMKALADGCVVTLDEMRKYHAFPD